MTRVMTTWSQNCVQLIMFEMHITNIGPDAVMASIPPAYSVGDLETCQYGGFNHQFGYIGVWNVLNRKNIYCSSFPIKKHLVISLEAR